MDIEKGAPAPAFVMPADGGDTVDLAALKGKNVVLYFYPRDDTKGCTNEALAFSEQADEFAAANTVIIGVSKDSVASHDKFKKKYGLSVILASDEETEIAEAYGVWKQKNMYGKTYMGIERSTFLIDADGKVREIWRKVKVPGHADAVLEAVKAL